MNYSKIQSIKLLSVFKNNGINFASVISAKLYSNDFRSLVSYIVLAVFFKPIYSIKRNEGAKILLSHNFSSIIRKDYLHIYNNFLLISEFDELSFERKLCLGQVFSNLFCFLREFKKKISLGLSLSELVSVASLESYYKRAHSNYKSIDFTKYTSYVSFCDSYLEENLIAQMANLANLTTATLQHGQYRVNSPGKETTDVESYLNFVSDYLFAWGEATKNEFIKGGVNPNRVLVCGSLKPFYETGTLGSGSKKYAVCIVLNGDSHLTSSLEMLSIVVHFCEKNSINYYIRPHPSSRNKVYLKYLSGTYCLGLHAESYSYQVSIIHSSGVFVEMVMKEQCFFVYKDEYLDDVFEVEGVCFSDEKELELLYAGDGMSEVDSRKLKSFYNVAENNSDLLTRYSLAVKQFLL